MLCGIGLWVYGSLSTEDEQSTTESTGRVAPMERQSQSQVRSNQKTSLPRDLESLDTYQDDYARSVALRALLATADQQSVISLLAQSKEIRPEDKRLTTQVEIFRRFAVIDPREALNYTFDIAWNRRARMVKAIFLEWATSDMDAAIQHAKTLESSDRRNALEAILRIQDDWTEDRIMKLAIEFGHESVGTDVLEQVQIARAFHDPRGAWMAILADAKNDDMQAYSLGTILELWVTREGFDVVSEALESISQMEYLGSILEPIVRPIAQDDPQRAFELINEFNENARTTAASIVVNEWAETDSVAAMDAVSKLDIRPSYMRDSFMREIGNAWAENAPYEAVENLPKYFSGYDLQSIRGNALQQIVRESPQNALDIMNKIPNGIEDLGGDLVKEWASADVNSVLNWISLQDETTQPKLLRNVIPALVETDPELALSTALNQSIAEGQIGLESEVVRILAQTDLRRATDMLTQIRDHDDTMMSAYSELGRALVRKNESSAAIEMGSDLPESLQDDYFRAIVNQIFNTDQAELYDILDLLPQRKYQQEAARYLIGDTDFGSYSHRYFTDEQLQRIRSFQ